MAKHVLPSTLTAFEILDAVDDWAGVGNPKETRILWVLLAALRGPDVILDKHGDADHLKSSAAKSQTTARLRREILPNVAKGHAEVSYMSFDARETKDQTLNFYTENAHFVSHILEALQLVEDHKADLI